LESRHSGEIVEFAVTDVRRLCKAVLEEEDPARLRLLLDELLQILDERKLVASLF